MVRRQDFDGVTDGLYKTLSQDSSRQNEAIHEKPPPK